MFHPRPNPGNTRIVALLAGTQGFAAPGFALALCVNLSVGGDLQRI